MLSTNLVFSEWTRIFKHRLTTVAAIDRVVHHSVILDLMGMASYRVIAARAAQQAPSREEQPAEEAALTAAGSDWLGEVVAPEE